MTFLASAKNNAIRKLHIRADPKASLPITYCGKWLNEYVEIEYDESLDRCKRCLPDVSGFAPRNEFAARASQGDR